MGRQTIGQLVIDLQAQTSKFHSDMNKTSRMWNNKLDSMQRTAKNFGTAIKAYFSFQALKGLSNFVQDNIAWASSMAKVADTVGLSLDKFQGLSMIVKELSIEQSTFERAIQRMTRRIGEAAEGTGTAKDAYSKLGIQITDSAGKVRDTFSIFLDVARHYKKLKTEADELNVSNQLFGRGFEEINLLLRQGAPAIETQIKKFARMGLIIKDPLIRQAELADDSLTEMKDSVSALGKEFSLVLAPAIKTAADAMRTNVGAMRLLFSKATWNDWLTGNPLKTAIMYNVMSPAEMWEKYYYGGKGKKLLAYSGLRLV